MLFTDALVSLHESNLCELFLIFSLYSHVTYLYNVFQTHLQIEGKMKAGQNDGYLLSKRREVTEWCHLARSAARSDVLDRGQRTCVWQECIFCRRQYVLELLYIGLCLNQSVCVCTPGLWFGFMHVCALASLEESRGSVEAVCVSGSWLVNSSISMACEAMGE